MGECLVGFSHTMGVVSFLDRGTFIIECGYEFIGQPLGHTLSGTASGEGEYPADGQGGPSFGPDLHRNLVVGAADPSRSHLEIRFDIIHRFFEYLYTGLFGLLLDYINGVVENPFGDRPFTVSQQAIYEPGNQDIVEFWIRFQGILRDCFSPGHFFYSLISAILLFFRPSRSVFASTFLSIINTGGIKRSPNNMIPDAGEILYPASSYEDQRMFLKVVTLAGDISGNLHAIGQPDTGHFPQCRIGFFGRRSIDSGADTAALRAFM
jgi:hypothetical protein